MARASGSYPAGRWFKSDFRYHSTKCGFLSAFCQYGPLVKRLRHRPFTAVTGVRFSYGSPKKNRSTSVLLFFFGDLISIIARRCGITSRSSQHCSAASVSEALWGGANSPTGHAPLMWCFFLLVTRGLEFNEARANVLCMDKS